MNEKQVLARIAVLVIMFGAIITTMILCTSCKVTRTTTTESLYLQRGDTTALIQSTTIETYDATKK